MNEHPKTNAHQLYIFSHLVSQADSAVELLYTTKGPRNTPVTQRNFISRVPRQRADQTACTRTQKKYMAKQKKGSVTSNAQNVFLPTDQHTEIVLKP